MAQRWTPEQAWKWYDKKPWPVGCNFLPSTAINDVEMWQAESFDEAAITRELTWAADAGYNSVRLFLQFLVWDADPKVFYDRFDRFLSIAAQRGLNAAVILFDDCCFAGQMPFLGKQNDPKPGVHNSGWVPSPGWDTAKDKAQWPRLEEYIRGMVRRFGGDERVLIWDIYNEPGAAGERLDSTELLQATFDWARLEKPSQPITVGVFSATMDGTKSLQEIAAANPYNRIMIENSDVLSFHNYCPLNWAHGSIKVFREGGRPLFCTEWMARGPMESLFQTHLPVWKAAKVACYNWGLVAGKTQTYFPWNNQAGPEMPKVWHHDVLRPDGTPFDPAEIEALRAATKS